MQYEINNSKLYVTVNIAGAEVKGLRDLHGMEYIWPGDDTYWSYSSPILFPVIGCVRNGSYIYNDKRYDMPQHGFCRTSAFKKIAGRTDAITLRLCADEQTKKQYPFDFVLDVNYELHDFSLVVKFKVGNCGSAVMPFTIGAHPAIRIPLEAEESLTDYRIKFSKRETADCPAITTDKLIDSAHRTPVLQDTNILPLRHDWFVKDALVFDDLHSRSVEMYSIISGRGVRMDFNGFDYFAVWQPKAEGAPFVCLEPWTGTATQTQEDDRLESKRGMRMLSPGECFEIQYTLTVL